MKNFIIIFPYFLAGSLLHAQNIKDGKAFTIEGTFSGTHTKVISIVYGDVNGTKIAQSDTLRNSRFKFTGSIKEPTWVYLFSDLSSNTMEDNNYIEFFIEPKIMNIRLEEDHFRRTKAPGSETQDRYDSLEKSKLFIYSQQAPLDSQLVRLNAEFRSSRAKNDSARQKFLNDEISEVVAKGRPYRKQLDRIDLEFITHNPDSYLSAFLLQKLVIHRLDKDSIAFYFNRLSANIQSSNLGKEIKIKLDGILPIGAIFPDLEGINARGDKRSKNDWLKNDYTLIIFWASWCQPCREQIPAYKELYAQYQQKGLGIVLITLDKSKDDWVNAIKAEGLGNFEHIFFDREKLMALYYKAGLNGIPAEILLKKDIVIAKYAGANDQNLGIEDVGNKLKELFK